MQSSNIIIKFLWFVSILAFLFVLLYGYYLLPDVVCIKFSSNGSALEYWERKYIFYVFTGTFSLFNVLMLALEKMYFMLPYSKRAIPNKRFWISSEEKRQRSTFIVSSWVYSFLTVINFSIIGTFGVIWKVNYTMQSNINEYSWVFILIATTLALWIIYLPGRLSINKPA